MALPEPAIDKVALYFKALSDPTRLRMLNALRERECSVGELTEATGCSQANVSKHLRVLADCGIVRRTARGTTTLVGIKDPAIFDLCALVCDSVARELASDVELHRTLSAPQAGGGKPPAE